MNAALLFHVAIQYQDGSTDSHTAHFDSSFDAVMCAQEVMDERPGKVVVKALHSASECHAAQRLAQAVIAKARAA